MKFLNVYCEMHNIMYVYKLTPKLNYCLHEI